MQEHEIKEITLDGQQLKAVELCTDVQHRLAAVSGPAGSGKTTIIRQVHTALVKRGISVALAAPTGKAARRIKNATGINAVTVHKLLEYNRPGERDPKTGDALDTTKPKRGRLSPLDYKVVIVDEYAMINYELHDNLMAAMPNGGCVRAFGDVNQLPPIKLHGERIVDSRVDPTVLTPFQKLLNRKGDSVVLDQVYRQAEGSNILLNANKIRKGYTVPVNNDLGDFYVKLTDKPIPLLKETVLKELEEGISYGVIENQIITPSKKSWVGTIQLNGILRTILNPNPIQTMELPRYEWNKDNRVEIGIGDKVVCEENTYDLRDYFERYYEWTNDMKPIASSYIPCPDNKQMLNGETGIVTHIYPDGGIDIDFGDRIVEVPPTYAEYWQKRDIVIDVQPGRVLNLAYALTTHKCQGSEFERVIYLMNKAEFYTLSRQNFYTGVTRASKRVMVITDQSAYRTSLAKVRIT